MPQVMFLLAGIVQDALTPAHREKIAGRLNVVHVSSVPTLPGTGIASRRESDRGYVALVVPGYNEIAAGVRPFDADHILLNGSRSC
jgi:hypothetical protein